MIPMQAVIKSLRDVEAIIRRKGIGDRDRYVRHVESVMHEALQGRTPKTTEWDTIVEWAGWLLTTETRELITQIRSDHVRNEGEIQPTQNEVPRSDAGID